MTPEEGPAVRFTQSQDAFYILTLYAPNETLVLDAPVPYVPGGLDQVVVVGGNASGAVVPSEVLGNGSLRLNISQEIRDADEYAWVFKIGYDENATSPGSGSGSGPTTVSGGVNVERNVRAAWCVVLAVVVGGYLMNLL